LLSRSLGFRALSLEDPTTPLVPPGALFESLGLGRSDAGVLVNEHQAMRITTAHACVKIISEDLSSTSQEIFQELTAPESMRLAKEHRLWEIIHDQPNPNMSAMVFWGALIASAVGWGNGYAWIKRDGAARVISLVPLKSGLTAPVKLRGELKYATTQTDTGAVAYLEPKNVLHIMGVSFDGVSGLGPVTCMNAFGLAAAQEKFGAQFFGNGARATGILTHPGQLEDEAYENLKKSIREWATGENALRPIILEEGMDWKQITVAPNEAQFLQARQYQRTEIVALYRVPLHLIGDLQRATNNNIEHQSIDYVRYCLRPWAVKIEQEVNRKLLAPPYLMEHNFQDLQRGDFASQSASYMALRNGGVYSGNDVLRAMRQNPIPREEGGDVRIVQGAYIPLSSLVAEEGDPAAAETAGTDSDAGASNPFNRRDLQILSSFRPLFRDAVGRSIHRGKDREFVYRAFQPAVSSLVQTQLAARSGNCELTKRELDLIARQTTAIADMATGWEKRDAAAIATRLTETVYRALAEEIL